MARLTSILILAALALPYARTPMCSSAGHEHEGHRGAHAQLTAHDGHGGDASDCHTLMACDTTLQGTTLPATNLVERRSELVRDDDRLAARHESPLRQPIPPPPQVV